MLPRASHACPPNRLRQLRAFCQTAQTGSVSKAAQRLCVSQPSVSQLIKTLEQDLDTQLFERHGPRICLTDSGRVLLETALPLMQAMENLPAVFRERMGAMSGGALDIAAGESTILYLLPEYVKRYSDRYPHISLHLHNVTGRDGLALLRSGEVDFAVGSMIEIPEDVAYLPIFSYDPMLITPLDHPLARKKHVTLEEVSRCGLILPPRHLSTWRIVDLVFRQHGLDYHVVIEAGGWEVIKKFVELGLGVSIVTNICLTGSEKLAAIPLRDYFPTRSYGVVMRRHTELSPQARRFVEMMDPDFAIRSKEERSGAGAWPAKRGFSLPGRMDFTGDDQSLP